ncbi:hypothetical protein Taro_026867 [Colocasia esculenta]|uniref:Pentatricopeptide repeat-containing protein n=1 Tax=Colocasia esculenta TaxID=4460 RepID=A0A843VGF8_COLES|nr:hypothetical protein [Colocasia esculenta]
MKGKKRACIALGLARSRGKPAPPPMSIPARTPLLFRPLLLPPGHLNRTAAAIPRHYHLRHPPPPPDRLSLTHPILSKLESCTPDLAHFNQIHARAVATGLCDDAFAASRLIKFLTCRLETPDLRRAALLLSQVQHPDVFAYNLLLQAFSRSSTPLQSVDFYRDLLCRGLRPNGYSLCFLLACCARGLALREGRQVHGHLCKMGLDFETYAGTSLVHMYGECGDLMHARHLFDEMPHRTGVSWSAMVGAYATCGCLVEALRLFREMLRACIEVTNSAAVSALCACAKLGDLVLGRMNK